VAPLRPDLYQANKRALELLRDPGKLRQRLKACLQPDGSVVFRFAPDAAEFLRKKMSGS
jgi:hypothetical protein